MFLLLTLRAWRKEKEREKGRSIEARHRTTSLSLDPHACPCSSRAANQSTPATLAASSFVRPPSNLPLAPLDSSRRRHHFPTSLD
ncbi:hypothetical protein PanWU01x14_248250, partial [Parasponia andersonii]